MLDGSSSTVLDDLHTLDREIALYKDLSRKARIVAVNKVDLAEVQASLPAMRRCLAGVGAAIFYISAVSGEAVLELTRKAVEMVEEVAPEEEVIARPQIAVFRPKPRK
jgi:GTPase involved in cell partitioning and DNA repair